MGLRDFHRVHNAYYFDNMLRNKGNSKWGIISVGLSEAYRKVYTELKVQDSLYSVVSKKPNGLSKIRVIGSILDCLQAPDEMERVIKLIGSNDIKMVSLTIKESNYHFNSHFTALNVDHPFIQYDLISTSKPPRTPVGLLIKGLHLRYKQKGKPLSILCLDNLLRGGEITRVMVETFAVHRYPLDTGFHTWLHENIFYPNSVCDRICLTDPLADSIALQQIAGVRDRALVTTESFKDWAIEKWMGDKPEGMDDTVRFVNSTIPFENLKIRLNYGTRLSVAVVAYSLGYTKFEDALRDPAVLRFMHAYMNEVGLGLGTSMPPEINLEEYKEALVVRMATKQLKYMTRRVVEDASTKLLMDMKPVLESLPPNAPTKAIGVVVAAWANLLAATPSVQSSAFHPLIDHKNDVLEPIAKRLVHSAKGADVAHASEEFLSAVFGKDAKFNNALSADVVTALQRIETLGIKDAINKIC